MSMMSGCLRAAGEDLIDLLLGVLLADALLRGNDLDKSVTVAGSAGEVLWGEFWELGSESGSGFLDTHFDWCCLFGSGVVCQDVSRGPPRWKYLLVCR